MRVQINKSEYYPDYVIDDEIDDELSVVDIPEDKLKWIKKVNSEWFETQDYLEKLYNSTERSKCGLG